MFNGHEDGYKNKWGELVQRQGKERVIWRAGYRKSVVNIEV